MGDTVWNAKWASEGVSPSSVKKQNLANKSIGLGKVIDNVFYTKREKIQNASIDGKESQIHEIKRTIGEKTEFIRMDCEDLDAFEDQWKRNCASLDNPTVRACLRIGHSRKIADWSDDEVSVINTS